ncbi:MAG TPA: pyruvate synthase subunit PorD [Spirochaetota bacterium]|nr:pyruvate synthase subunit PorD [Spirochaetota bacterium]
MKIRGWKDLNEGPVIKNPGNSILYKTGSWRSFKPVFLKENCTDCLLCWLYCPDMSVVVENGQMRGFNYDYCKGCGICANECPGKKRQKAIVMEQEGK